MELTQRMQNQIFLDALTSGDERKRKEAQDIASEYVQKQAHEGGILRHSEECSSSGSHHRPGSRSAGWL